MFEASAEALIEELDEANAEVARAQRRFLREIKRAGEIEIWRHAGARDLAHWLSMRYGISSWKAHRWIGAAGALDHLPQVDGAFTDGTLSLDKTVELARFATVDDEGELVRWSANVSSAAVRRRADPSVRPNPDDVEANERARSLSWWCSTTASAWDSRASYSRRKAPSS